MNEGRRSKTDFISISVIGFVLVMYCINIASLFFILPIYHIQYWLLIFFYFFVAVFLLREKKNIAIFHIEKISLFLIILFGTFFHRRFAIEGEYVYLILLRCGSLMILFALAKGWKNIPWGNIKGLIIFVVVTSLIILGLLVSNISRDLLPLEKSVAALFVREAIYNLSFISPLEEFIFRGFLWGTMIRWGWSEKKVAFIQAIIFCVLHFRTESLVNFLFLIPISAIVCTYFAYKSKGLFLPIIAHTIINSLY